MEQKFPKQEQEQSLYFDGFIHANLLVDRGAIELKAQELIDTRAVLEVPVLQQERENNARTAIMEAVTAKGHLSVVRIEGGTVDEINAQVLNRLINGWDDSLPTHEKKRRFAEICEELTIQKIHTAIARGDVPPDTEVSTISDYPSALGSLAQSLGYRSSNKKGMIRCTRLEQNSDGTFTRVIEQVSRSNGNWKSTFRLFEAANIPTREGPADLVALENLFIYSRQDYADGVIDVTRTLDLLSGPNIRYGENVTTYADNLIEYENLRTESARREEKIEVYTKKLAKLEAQLDERVAGGILTYEQRQELYLGEVSRILDAICLLQPAYVAETFGQEVVAAFEEAACLYAQGYEQEALQIINNTQHLKQAVLFCGASISFEKAMEMGLDVNSVGDLVTAGKETWKWKMGICVVKTCPTRPGKTEVGPCSVCRGCQYEFDGKKRTDIETNVVSIFDFIKTKPQKENFWQNLFSKAS